MFLGQCKLSNNLKNCSFMGLYFKIKAQETLY